MTVQGDSNQLAAVELVTMFQWDASAIGGGQLYWHPGTTAFGANPIVWQGITYNSFAIEATGFEMDTAGGRLPRPTLRAANVGGQLGAYLRSIGDGLNAKVTRKRTLGRYLDPENFPDGNPYANSNSAYPDDIYYVAAKKSENPVMIEIELAAKWDTEGVMLPRRQVIASTCQWVYRSAECSYAGGPVYTDPVYPGQDICSKTLDACKARFGEFGVLRTSAFPASLLVRQ